VSSELANMMFPMGYLHVTQFIVALLIGLTLSGSYGPGDARRSYRRVFAGVSLAVLLTLYSSFRTEPFFLVLLQVVGTALAFAVTLTAFRWIVDRIYKAIWSGPPPARTVVIFGDGSGTGSASETEELFRSGSKFEVVKSFPEPLGNDFGTHLAEAIGEHAHDRDHLNILEACRQRSVKRIFYSSSACMYPEHNQMDPENPNCAEDSAYPADPDSEYGWEKLFSERLYLAFARNHGMEVRIARFHNIFGPEGTWEGGREKAPAAFCRKIAMASDGDAIEMWGDGERTRSFLYIDECIEGVLRLTRSDWTGPVNIGSDEMVSINRLATMVAEVAGKKISIEHIPGPLGVRGRNSDNRLIREKLSWGPDSPLVEGVRKTYAWVEAQVMTACGQTTV
jgi:nucleoside-diphosphate-sugar epimerase